MKIRLPNLQLPKINLGKVNDLEKSLRPVLSAIGVSGMIETSTITALGDELAGKGLTDYQLRMLLGVVKHAVKLREDAQLPR